MKNLVTTDWLEENLENVRLIDGSWHMPNSNRNGDRKSTRLNSSHSQQSRMPSSA